VLEASFHRHHHKTTASRRRNQLANRILVSGVFNEDGVRPSAQGSQNPVQLANAGWAAYVALEDSRQGTARPPFKGQNFSSVAFSRQECRVPEGPPARPTISRNDEKPSSMPKHLIEESFLVGQKPQFVKLKALLVVLFPGQDTGGAV
jgi:hypothetical protein